MEERERRERERREFKEAQELESLRRAFKRIDKSGDGHIDVNELLNEMKFLGYSLKEREASLWIWEVDDDADGQVDWEEFRTTFYRVRDDQTGCEPRKFFNMIEFVMYDKNMSGSIDLDECMSLLYGRYGKAMVEEVSSELGPDEVAAEKMVSFTRFVNLQSAASKKIKKAAGGDDEMDPLKKGCSSIPQVKPIGMLTDPKAAHLI